MLKTNTTIASLATGNVNCAIHIIRVSGNNTYKILNKICSNNITKKGYSVQKTKIIKNKKQLDEVLLIKFVSPKSFTGEDMIEINCHGGYYLVNSILNLLLKNGCVLATPGEYSKRAFLNNKISLNNANAINNLINAKSDFAIEAANNGLSKITNKQIMSLINDLFSLIGNIEVNIDYPEYNDTPKVTKNTILSKLNNIKSKLQKIFDISTKVEKISSGYKIAIIGKPNAGKSSLLNLLVNEDKAIVSNIPGTTTDSIEASINIDGVNYTIVDTAGIRNTKKTNKIEEIGIKKTFENITKADLVIFLVDGTNLFDNYDQTIIDKIKNKKYVIAINKNDKKCVFSINDKNQTSISVKNKQIESLINWIKSNTIKIDFINSNVPIIQTKQSIGYIENSITIIDEIHQQLKSNVSTDLLMNDLHNVYNNLNKIIGIKDDIDFINEMFKNFCLGK